MSNPCWTALQAADKQLNKRGLAFGETLYKCHAKSKVVRGGTTFTKMLEKLGIPRTTA